jgi:hypothetical protein
MCLWSSRKDLDEQDLNGINFVTFGFRMWEILTLKCVISAPENPNKF